ncbi:MAG TPA: glycoside hydrolase family 30 beta sandwich domain-containing protein [Gemmatirosa sp.]
MSLAAGWAAFPARGLAAARAAVVRARPVTPASGAEWVVTTRDAPWQVQSPLPLASVGSAGADVYILPGAERQPIEGFGACFNELGWAALALLRPDERDAILRELFAPGVGANFTLCRMPLGANDFSREWYSYDETDGDFELQHFSIARDRETLVPFIEAARRHQPALRLWASPWSPPTWMKTNRHYAAALPRPASGVENGLRPDQVGREGTDMFVLEDRYLHAYARYFARFVEAYRGEGIRVEMVMPQNEFNSAQVFPSCTWTPAGLARFVAVLGPEMERLGVRVFFGTQERADPGLLEAVLRDPAAGRYVRGAGFQWAGKGAIAAVHRAHPDLPLYQTEQECGDGRNDWRYARYTWTLMKHYLTNGARAYQYWNLALQQGGVSRWGWAQNSLVVVDPSTRVARYTHEYYLMKHLSHHVRPGARRLETTSWTGYENQLAFRNPDGSVVLVLQNDLAEPLPVRVLVNGNVVAPTLPPDSFATIVVRG